MAKPVTGADWGTCEVGGERNEVRTWDQDGVRWISCAAHVTRKVGEIMSTPLMDATGELRETLIYLAVTHEDDPNRPCCDGETTLYDWHEAGFTREMEN